MNMIDTSRGRSVLHIGWRKARKMHIEKNSYCIACGYQPKKAKGLDVHHIKPRHVRPDLATDQTNLVTLCRKYDCHLRIGHWGNYRQKWNPNVVKRLGQIAIGLQYDEKEFKESLEDNL